MDGEKNKICLKCNEEKSLDCFSKNSRKKDGLSSVCRHCISVYRETKKESLRKGRKRYRLLNPEKVKSTKKRYYENNKDVILLKQRAWSKSHHDRVNLYSRLKRKTDIQFRLRQNLRSRFNDAIKGNYKAGSAVRDLGCSISDLVKYIEARFLPGMSWDNYGKWHIDHIKPLANFDLTDPKQVKIALNYKNLQPLWAVDNLSKGSK